MSKWPAGKFANFATEVSRPVALSSGVPYRSVGVKWYGEGVHVHETRQGHEFEAERFEIRADDLIYNDMWARKGSVAIVPSELSGAVASSHFPTFELSRNLIEPRYLHWFFKTPAFWDECETASRGSTGRNQIKRRTFLAIPIPLPPVADQRRVVAQIEELVAQTDEACSLRQQAAEETEALCRAILANDTEARRTPMSELVHLRPPDVAVQASEDYQFAGVYCFGRGVFRSQAKSGMDFAYPRLTRLRTGNFVYPKLMAWEGAFGVVPPECNACVVSTEFPVFEVNENLVCPEVLDTYFRTPAVWPEVAGDSTGTNVRRRRLNPQDFLNYKMPLPSRKTQLLLRDVRAQVDALKRLQAETAVELDALLPAILDRAFKGEL
jgi:type I restriction enzyme, S subunit